ncbi:DNA mismatch repair protein MutL [Spirosomataceae bacterium TFI 002]|nr:DNA mismatch repair protein MutL [Spirosomataceae bacterium TFI 002]
MDIIQLLSDNIANQIAAGEVVQRPASVVKELMENAIDAKASEVKLIIKDAGKVLIQVIDDGAGMSLTDARMSFERHATSKIRKSEDLFKIMTMGFRGEALASIAAVAQVEMKTQRSEDEVGTLLKIEGSEFKSQEPVSTTKGTSIQVKNLFFNVPARRNFLKTNAVEMKHILEEFTRVALAHPQITFEAYHNDIELYRLPADKLSKRIVDIFGKGYREQLASCEENTPFVNISGYIGKPEAAKKSRGEQYFFVNDRFIKSPYLHHAVTGAFEATIPAGAHPFYVLNIEIDPSHIDINIHPTKTEIKFDDEKAIYAILRSAVRKAIGVYNLTPSIDFESDINFANLSSARTQAEPRRSSGDSRVSISNFEKQPVSNWKSLYEGLEDTPPSLPKTLESKANDFKEKDNNEIGLSALQIHQKYIVTQVKSGLMLIDQKAAYERIFYEKYLKNLSNKAGNSQQLLFQKTLNLSAIDFSLAMDLKEAIHALGFGFEEFGQNTVLISGVPADLTEEDAGDVLKDLLNQYRINENDLKTNKTENLARSIAKRVASRSLKKLDNVEIMSLINQLFECSVPTYTPSGKAITHILDLSKLNELIGGS